MNILLPAILLLLTISACGAAKVPPTDTSDQAPFSAAMDKMDERCRHLFSLNSPFVMQAQSSGFVTGKSGVLFDLQLESGTLEQHARQALGEIAFISFMDIGLGRASAYIRDREGLAAVSRLPFVRFIHSSHRPVSR